MATYIELINASQDSAFRQKIAVACVVAAETIRIEVDTTPNHAARFEWAKLVYRSPTQAGDSMIWPVLAQNKAVAIASIIGASDATIQTAVDAAIAAFI